MVRHPPGVNIGLVGPPVGPLTAPPRNLFLRLTELEDDAGMDVALRVNETYKSLTSPEIATIRVDVRSILSTVSIEWDSSFKNVLSKTSAHENICAFQLQTQIHLVSPKKIHYVGLNL